MYRWCFTVCMHELGPFKGLNLFFLNQIGAAWKFNATKCKQARPLLPLCWTNTPLTFCILLVLLFFLLFINVSSSPVTLASFVSYSLNFSSLGLSGDSRKITLSWYVQLVNCRPTTITPPTLLVLGLAFLFLLFFSILHPSLCTFPPPCTRAPPPPPCCIIPNY